MRMVIHARTLFPPSAPPVLLPALEFLFNRTRSGRFVCFRCQARGDVIGFVQQLEHVSFRDAAARLDAPAMSCHRSDVHRRTPTSASSPRTILDLDELRVLAAAVDLYTNRLQRDKAALDYLAGRGFGRHLLERENVGFALGDELDPYLRWRQFPVAAAMRVDLLRDDGGEVLAGRIVFPEFR